MLIRREQPADIPAVARVHASAFRAAEQPTAPGPGPLAGTGQETGKTGPAPASGPAPTPGPAPASGPGPALASAATVATPDEQPREVALVRQLRDSAAWIPALSLVAELDGQVVGHVVCSRATIGVDAAVGLGPIGVSPEHQGRGVGHGLMHAVLGAADALDVPLVGLLGEPTFYRRFGFVPGAQLRVVAPDPGWGEYFQVRPLAAWTPRMRGPFTYAAPFREQ